MPPASALATWRWSRNHSNQRGKSVTTSIFTSARGSSQEAQVDVDPRRLRRRPSGSRRARAARAGRRGRRCARTSRPRTRAARAGRTTPSSRSPSQTRAPSRSSAHHSPSPSAGSSLRRRRSAPRRAAPRRRRGPRSPSRRTIGRSVGAGAAHDLGLRARDGDRRAEREQRASRRADVEAPVEPVGPSRPARRAPARGSIDDVDEHAAALAGGRGDHASAGPARCDRRGRSPCRSRRGRRRARARPCRRPPRTARPRPARGRRRAPRRGTRAAPVGEHRHRPERRRSGCAMPWCAAACAPSATAGRRGPASRAPAPRRSRSSTGWSAAL